MNTTEGSRPDKSRAANPVPDKPDWKPTWRKPAGVIALVLALCAYAVLVASASAIIGQWHVLMQTLAYVVLGTIWLLPLRRFLIWMETGRWG